MPARSSPAGFSLDPGTEFRAAADGGAVGLSEGGLRRRIAALRRGRLPRLLRAGGGAGSIQVPRPAGPQ